MTSSLHTHTHTPPVLSWATSGTTIRVPVKSHLSPACATSTISPLRTTSRLGRREDNYPLLPPLLSPLSYSLFIHSFIHSLTHSLPPSLPHPLGMVPLGSSCWVSWMRTFWKSTNLDAFTSNMNFDLLVHRGFLHTVGCGDDHMRIT